jgi:arsenate reductase (thioredoxin)
MAAAFLKSMAPEWVVVSAGTRPAGRVHPDAVRVMQEVGIDISDAIPRDVDRFLDQDFDHVITVCDHAREICPVFHGIVRHRLHYGFEDPAAITGSREEVLAGFRRIRDEIRISFAGFYRSISQSME